MSSKTEIPRILNIDFFSKPMEFNKLFQPIRIGGTCIKNRIVMSAMGGGRYLWRQSIVPQVGIEHYTRRARGGTGLLITGTTKVSTKEPTPGAGDNIITNQSLQSLNELAKNIHFYDAKIFVQLQGGSGRVSMAARPSFRPTSASEVPCVYNPSVKTRALTIEEIENFVKDFGRVARILRIAGIDGVELHAHDGYVLDQFVSKCWNKRADKYGGDLEGRLRFPIEIMQAIKDNAGKDFPVVYKYGIKHFLGKGYPEKLVLNANNFSKEDYPGSWHSAREDEDFVEAGRDIDEGLEIAKGLEKAGFDALSIDAGCYENFYPGHRTPYQPHGHILPLVAQVKKAVDIPVMAVSGLGIPEIAEKALVEGKADMIVLGRPLLADENWSNKVKARKIEDIRPCLSCHDGCMPFGDPRIVYPLTVRGGFGNCVVNALTGRSSIYMLKRAENLKAVLVVGGGVAGMEAARVTAIRGHKVMLYEENNKLGGHLIARSNYFGEDIKLLLKWYKRQLKKLNVDIHLGTEITLDLIRKLNLDVVIVATGSTEIIPKVPGIYKPNVATAKDLLLGRKEAGDTVAVIGAGLVGCETAVWLGMQDKKVIIVEMLPSPILNGSMFMGNRQCLIDLLRKYKVKLFTNTRLKEVTDEGIIVIDENSVRKPVKCDTIALAVGLKSDRDLYESIRGEIAEIYTIGDCQKPRKILNAIWDGYFVAYSI